jgi:hypothetical protein
LAVNRSAIDALHTELRMLCDKLNEDFPKSKKIFVNHCPYSESLRIEEEETYNDVFCITVTKVRGTYEFSEQIGNPKQLN